MNILNVLGHVRMELINSIIKYEFLQNAYIVGILIGMIAPILGCYVIVRRLSIVVEGIAHISVAGVAFSFLLGSLGFKVMPFTMALIFAIIGGVLLEILSSFFKDFKEVSVPILISFSAALMIFFAGFANGFNQDLNSYLFGNILTATKLEIYLLFLIMVIFIVFIYKNFYKFVSLSIDPNYCKFSKIDAKTYKVFMTIVLSVVTAVCIKAVGVFLVSSLVILPVTTAMKFSKSFKQTLISSIIISEIAIIIGLTLAYYLDISSGATIIFANLGLFVVAVLVTKIKRMK